MIRARWAVAALMVTALGAAGCCATPGPPRLVGLPGIDGGPDAGDAPSADVGFDGSDARTDAADADDAALDALPDDADATADAGPEDADVDASMDDAGV